MRKKLILILIILSLFSTNSNAQIPNFKKSINNISVNNYIVKNIEKNPQNFLIPASYVLNSSKNLSISNGSIINLYDKAYYVAKIQDDKKVLGNLIINSNLDYFIEPSSENLKNTHIKTSLSSSNIKSLKDDKTYVNKININERQFNNNWCLSICVSQMLRSKNIYISGFEIINESYKNLKNKNVQIHDFMPQHKQINDLLLNKYKLNTKLKTVKINSIKDIENILKNKKTITLEINKNNEKIYHGVVVNGYIKETNSMIIWNPWDNYYTIKKLDNLIIPTGDGNYDIKAITYLT